MGHWLKVAVALAALQLFAAAAAPARQGSGQPLLPGVWGGERIRFEVKEGGAAVEYDCARGTVEGRILVDRRGRFSVAGTQYEGRGGASPEGYRVRLTGVVGGSLMRLSVRRADTGKLVGTFDLARDRAPELVKCR